MDIQKLRLGIASTVGGVALVGAGLFLGPGIVGAQTPSPTPAPQDQTTPAPSDSTTPDGKECDGDRPADGSSSTGVRSGSPRGGTGVRF